MRDSTGMIRSMGITGTALTGRPCHVRQMDMVGQVAYHLRQKLEDIIAIDFQYDFKRPEDEATTILYGLFTHEIMHAIRTDSDYKDRRLKDFPTYERMSRKDVWNIVEDPAIEYLSKWEVSETLHLCLQKSIQYFYEESPTIQECGKDAYLQLIAALVMFGDLGMLKGEFTFPEALEAFKKCAPIMLEAIEEPDARRRFELSQDIFEIIRPLWEEHQKNDLVAGASEKDMLSDLGVSESNGTGTPVSNNDYGAGDNGDPKMEQRKQIVAVLEMENPNDKLGKIFRQAEASGQLKLDPDTERAIQDAVKQLIKQAEQNTGESKKTKRDFEIDDLHLVVRSPYYKDSCVSIQHMGETDRDEYERLCELNHSEIINFRSQIRKVFHDKYSKKEYSTTGRISVDRMCGRKLTARVFEKNRTPDDKSDMAIVLMVDQSSSMSRSMYAVRSVCTILMEAFSKFDIPIKLVGFSASFQADAVYYHYGKWNNDINTRMMIPGIFASGGTFLGHAIRYGGELLQKRPERHKLFIMVTDAEPCCRKYKTTDDAYSDCHYAVQDIRKYAEVFGLGIYDTSDEASNKAFRFIFGKNCVAVDQPSVIGKELPKRIGKILKS